MPISSHLRDPLDGLLEVNRLARRPDSLEDLPAAIAEAILDGLGFQAAAISLYRPAWDDFEVATVVGEEAASEALLECALDPGKKRRNGSSRLPDEPLRLPLQHSDGHVLGILSLLGHDRDPRGDGSLELVDAAATLAAQALETAQAEAEAERDRRALEELLFVSSRLTESHSVDTILQSVCDAIRRVLGFRLVVVELADVPADRYRPQAAAGIDLAGVDLELDAPIAALRALFDPAFEIEGCYLLPREDAVARVGAEPSFQSTQNGRGPLGWNRHWLLVPLYDRAGEARGFIWVDDPEDRLIPPRSRLQALRLFADQAATALDQAEQFEALRETDEQRRALIEGSPVAIIAIDAYGVVKSWNRAAEEMFGWSASEAIGRLLPYVQDTALPEFKATVARILAGESLSGLELTRQRRDGTEIDVSVSTSPIRDADGNVAGVMATVTDITERKRIERDLARQNAELEALHETTLDLIERLDLASMLETIVARAASLTGSTVGYLYVVEPESEQLRVAVGLGVFAQYVGESLSKGDGLAGKVWQEGRTIAVRDYSTWDGRAERYSDAGFHAIAGVPIWSGTEIVGVLGVAYTDPDRTFSDSELALLNRFGRLASLALDNARLYERAQAELAERRDAEEALRQSQELYRSVVENSRDLILLIDVEGQIRYASPASETILGYAGGELVGRNGFELIHPEDHEAVARVVASAVKEGRSDAYVARVRHKDGHWVEMEGVPTAIRNDEGKAEAVLGIARDVSERVRAAEERTRLQEQLRQSQKMEAVGRLAGGIAHDFNNLLTAISGYGELALTALEERAPARSSVMEMQRAAERAASLTRQLLAFSRRQVLQPKVIDLNDIVLDLEKMLARVLRADIELVTALDPELVATRADPGQIEQVILNLAINARDAMPQGGVLTVATANAELDEDFVRRHPGSVPGRFVMLAVSDSGEGMSPETLEHVFEPFFTTKPQGQGTGLGLSTVYGIVKQTGGQIWARSEPGHGTTVEVYLPRAAESAATEDEKKAAGPRLSGNETVLLVEDEEIVRNLVREMLETAGYAVLHAADGSEAITLSDRHAGTIDLLMTDVVMPGLSGLELARRLVSQRPDLRVLFTSGYAEDAIANHGVLSPGTAFLEKPFTAAELGRKLRELLDPKLIG